MIHCACLWLEKEGAWLLVRVRNHQRWYLPGGKIEVGEEPQQTLVRELKEELGMNISLDSLRYVTTVIGPNHDSTDQVTLICFTGDIPHSFKPAAEIAEVAWIKKDRHELMAPALRMLMTYKLSSRPK